MAGGAKDFLNTTAKTQHKVDIMGFSQKLARSQTFHRASLQIFELTAMSVGESLKI
jgi:hypothetical protein